jgi:hypothetical protein
MRERAHIPKAPPFSARENTTGGSHLRKIPVTSVTAVTTAPSKEADLGQPCFNEPMESGNQSPQAGDHADLVDQWLREGCVVTSGCASSVHGLHRSFSFWAKFGPDADVESMFAEELHRRGFETDEGGMIRGLALKVDFAAALEYERAERVCRQQDAGHHEEE